VRHLKLFGLAAMAVMAVMAYVGVTSAMAVTTLEKVVLCKTDPSPDLCPTEGHFLSGTVLHGELEAGSIAVLLSNIGNVECELSTVLGTTNQLLAHGLIEAVTFTMCKSGIFNCTVTTEGLNYLALVLLNTAHNGYHLIVSEGPELHGKPRAHVSCAGGFVNCTFGAPEILFEVLLKETDVVLDVLQELERIEGSNCGNVSTWHAKYLTRCLNSLSQLVGCWPRMETSELIAGG
jgi:hypothetical protein